MEEEAEKVLEPESVEDNKETSSLYQHEQSSDELTETEAACTGPALV